VSGVTVDPTGLSANAALYGAAADDVASIHLTLASKLDGEGACWGNDDAGNAFAAKYVGPALAALRMMITTQQGLQSMVDGVYQWSQSYVSADEALRQDLLKVFGSE
jgi:uncharacterized protein YukE